MNSLSNKIFNVGYENYTVKKIAEMVKGIVGDEVAIKYSKTDDLRSYHISSKKIEKELGFKSKKDIEKFGLENFVNKCKEATRHWAEVQTEQSKRLGYFMDWDNSYFTMSDENNYMIWHFLKKCLEKNLLYKGRDSVPWCPRCGTAISQHEILQEEYKELTHDSIFFSLFNGRDFYCQPFCLFFSS